MSYGSPPPIRRVPPPPPPGFGDEDYYKLYGRPEEYHEKRAKYESRVGADRSPSPRSSRMPSTSPPPPSRRHHEDHEEYYYYRRSRRPE